MQLNPNFKEKIYICTQQEIIKDANLWTVELHRILICFYTSWMP